jgi:phosphoribosylformimino-5-aminoimidazole carboxamide ribotide isomerase
MRVIPVIDLMGGQVVRGLAGQRDLYRPIRSQIAVDAQPATVARAFVERFGLNTAYVADLDAITSALDDKRLFVAVYERIAEAGLSLWLDAGIGTPVAARQLHAQLQPTGLDVHYVIGMETLAPQRELIAMRLALGRERTIFSLDLKQGLPLTQVPRWIAADPVEIVLGVLASGISRLIVLDLADVGMQGGTGTLGLCRRIRREYGAALELIAGGGVRSLDDLKALADAGCDAALVASALHDGRLSYSDIQSISTQSEGGKVPSGEREA